MSYAETNRETEDEGVRGRISSDSLRQKELFRLFTGCSLRPSPIYEAAPGASMLCSMRIP